MNSERKFEHDPTPPEDTGSFLPPDFQIPDLAIHEGQPSHTEIVYFSFSHLNLNLDAYLIFERNNWGEQTTDIKLSAEDEAGNDAITFTSGLRQPKNKHEKPFW